jgi:O-acetyl-ADP-ribose deacetylase (regulator of RNase III)
MSKSTPLSPQRTNRYWAEEVWTGPFIGRPGPELAEAGGTIGPCDPGDGKATRAFRLTPPARYIIHTVGPVWEGGDYGEAEILASCYRRCLEVADKVGARTIAFPAVATGVYGYPAEEAAQIAMTTLTSTPTGVELVRLVAFDEPTLALYEDKLRTQEP